MSTSRKESIDSYLRTIDKKRKKLPKIFSGVELTEEIKDEVKENVNSILIHLRSCLEYSYADIIDIAKPSLDPTKDKKLIKDIKGNALYFPYRCKDVSSFHSHNWIKKINSINASIATLLEPFQPYIDTENIIQTIFSNTNATKHNDSIEEIRRKKSFALVAANPIEEPSISFGGITYVSFEGINTDGTIEIEGAESAIIRNSKFKNLIGKNVNKIKIEAGNTIDGKLLKVEIEESHLKFTHDNRVLLKDTNTDVIDLINRGYDMTDNYICELYKII